MTRTMHGWHIPNTTTDDERFVTITQPCGGPTQCIPCGLEAGTVIQNSSLTLDRGGAGWYELVTREGSTHIVQRGEDGKITSADPEIEERHITDAHIRGQLFKLVRVLDVEAYWNRKKS